MLLLHQSKYPLVVGLKHNAPKKLREIGGATPRIRNLGTMCRTVPHPDHLSPGANQTRRWVGPIVSLNIHERRKILCVPGIELRFPSHSAASRVTTKTGE
jgi:hypothetical protein